jgi:ribosomal 50S subunit-associated protein YjgA (DUF615 family)
LHTQYEDFASEIQTVSQNNAVKQYTALKNLALSIAALAVNANARWPLYSIPIFQV